MAANENMPVEQDITKQGMGQRLWDFLTKPDRSITDRAEKRQARILAGFLLVFFVLTGIRLLVGLSSGSYLAEPEPFIALSILTIMIGVSYGLSRTAYYAWGSGVAVVSTIVVVLFTVLIRGDYEESRVFSALMWLIPAFVLGSAFFSWRSALVVYAATLGAILVMPFVVPGLEMSAVSAAFSSLLVVAILIVVVIRFRDQLEADRQLELNETNQELIQTRNFLEQRVAERTQALLLATDISRVLSQITNLQDLLQASVDTIRDRFNLYYAQIYLADAEMRILSLQAGTGNIGRELVLRDHRLVVGLNSINGSAAADKRVMVVSDTARNPLFKPNPLLPRTRSEMAVPLMIGERVVGVLDLQSDRVNALSNANLAAFEALAGQLAVAIENATLISETAVARAAVESYTRRITRENWSSYFDAIDHPQFLGFVYNRETLTPLESPLSQDLDSRNVAQVSIDVIGESIGAIQIEAEEERNWTASDLDLIQLVATQVGQQVEILRSLDEASYFRQEAEQALRRMTHDAWLDYEETPDLADGFVFDQKVVSAVTAVSPAAAPDEMLHHELSLHGEAIGELLVTKSDDLDVAFADELITAVADQLVIHLEKLRLSEQTEKALAESQRRGQELVVMNRVVSKISQVTGIQESMQIVVDELKEVTNVDQIRVGLLNKEGDKVIIIAENYDQIYNKSALGLEIPVAGNRLTEEVIQMRKAIFVADCQTSPYTESIRDMIAEQHIQSLLVMPIIVGNTVIGTVGFDVLTGQKSISDSQIQLAETLILQAGSAIQKAQLFEQTQARATELAVINEVAQTVAQQIDRQELLKSVQLQIQRILPVDAFFIGLYDHETGFLEYPYIYDEGEVYQTPPRLPTPNTNIHHVLQSGESMLINRTQQEIDALVNQNQETRLGKEERISASLLYIPLRTGQDISGVLSIQSYRLNAYSAADVSLLSSIANHVAVALDNSRLLTESRQTAEREQVLRGIAATINTSIDAESVLQTAAREIGRALGLETYVYLTPELGVMQSTVKTPVDGKQNGHGDRLR